jgi:hypothetical protein
LASRTRLRWILLLIAVADTAVYWFLAARITVLSAQLVLNLVWFGSLIAMAMLARWLFRRPAA